MLYFQSGKLLRGSAVEGVYLNYDNRTHRTSSVKLTADIRPQFSRS